MRKHLLVLFLLCSIELRSQASVYFRMGGLVLGGTLEGKQHSEDISLSLVSD